MRDLGGQWRNQNGSLLHLDVAADGTLSGWFESARGRAALGRRYRLHGCALGELASFVVPFRDDGADLAAITTFTARWYEDARGEHLHALWVLSREYEDAAQSRRTQLWNTFLTNHDVFDRLP
jgi:hypothetical protein